jgi:replicative DNA helicase
MLSDLRDSGTIEQDADIVMFLYRDDYYKKSDDSNNNEKSADHLLAKCSVAKNRHGSTNIIPLGWYGHLFKYTEIEERYND